MQRLFLITGEDEAVDQRAPLPAEDPAVTGLLRGHPTLALPGDLADDHPHFCFLCVPLGPFCSSDAHFPLRLSRQIPSSLAHSHTFGLETPEPWAGRGPREIRPALWEAASTRVRGGLARVQPSSATWLRPYPRGSYLVFWGLGTSCADLE